MRGSDRRGSCGSLAPCYQLTATEATIMAKERTDKSGTSKPATPAEQKAASKSTKDGLEKTRDNTQTRGEVREQKTPQGQPNRG
jgi:hypothetical protein